MTWNHTHCEMNGWQKRASLFSTTVICHIWVWIHELGRQVDRDTYFRGTFFLGGVHIRFLVSFARFPGSSRNGSGLCPNWWIQKKFVYVRQSVQNTGSWRIEFLKKNSLSPCFLLPLTPRWYSPRRLEERLCFVTSSSQGVLPDFLQQLPPTLIYSWVLPFWKGTNPTVFRLNWISVFDSILGKQNWIYGQN